MINAPTRNKMEGYIKSKTSLLLNHLESYIHLSCQIFCTDSGQQDGSHNRAKRAEESSIKTTTTNTKVDASTP